VAENIGGATASYRTAEGNGCWNTPFPATDSIVVRIARDGERYFPHRYADGLYCVANPALGRTKHHSENQIAIREAEIIFYLQKGFHLRMRGERSKQVNLIAASEIDFPNRFDNA